MRRAAVSGTVYLMHFSEPFGHARHYIGWAEDLQRRLAQDRARQGPTSAVTRPWPGSRSRWRNLARYAVR